MTEIDFLILVENVKRGELENACLLACELEKRGYTTKIRYYRNINRYFLKPKVVITPNCYSTNEIINYGCFFRCKSIKIVNLQYEQVLSERGENTKLYTITGLAKNAIHITWGNATRKRLEKKGISNENIAVTGHISMDLYDSKFNKLFLSKRELEQRYHIPTNKRWNLLASNFSYINDSVFRAVKDNLPDVDLSEQRKKMIESQKIILNWLEKAMDIYPDQIFIYRPHPSEEKTEKINRIQEKYSNFYYISEFSIKQWIRYSDEIMVYYSTSIVDAYFSKVCSHILRPLKISPNEDSRLMVNADKVETEEAFLKIFVEPSSYYSPIDKKLINDYYGENNYYDSYKKIADICILLLTNSKNEIFYSDINMQKYWNLKHFLGEMINKFICNVPIYSLIKKKENKYLIYKTDYYQNSHIKGDEKRIRRIISEIL